jgi:hypothetical protein
VSTRNHKAISGTFDPESLAPLGEAKNSRRCGEFFGAGRYATIPRPEILFSLALEDNFDPP